MKINACAAFKIRCPRTIRGIAQLAAIVTIMAPLLLCSRILAAQDPLQAQPQAQTASPTAAAPVPASPSPASPSPVVPSPVLPSPMLSGPSNQPSSPEPTAPSNVSGTASAPVVAGSPVNPEQLGDLHMARKRYQAAIQAYSAVSPKSATVWNKLGMAHQQMFDLVEAKKDYETSVKLDPRSADALNNLATIYYAQKQYSIAEHLYRKAIKLNQKSALFYKNLGTDLLAADKFKKGWESYQQALAIDPEIFENAHPFRVAAPTPLPIRGAMNYYLAKSYTRAGMLDRAIAYLRMALDERYTDSKKVLADKEFASLRDLSSFKQLIAEQRIQ